MENKKKALGEMLDPQPNPSQHTDDGMTLAQRLHAITQDHAANAAIELKRVIDAADHATKARQQAETCAHIAQVRLNDVEHTLAHAITATLGGAFQLKSDRARQTQTIWLGVLGLGVVGLLFVLYLVYGHTVTLIQERASMEHIRTQLLLNTMVMVGPIWLCWVATVRLAQTQAITEDYGYKAAIAQAYQGFSPTLCEKDEWLKDRLFVSVLSQLDRSPVRFLQSPKVTPAPPDDLLPPLADEAQRPASIKSQMVAWVTSKFKTRPSA